MAALRDSLRRAPVATLALAAALTIAYLLAIAPAGGSLSGGPSAATLVRYGAISYEFAHPASHCALGAAGFSQRVLCSGQTGVHGRPPAQPPTWETALSALLITPNLLALALALALLAALGGALEAALGPWRLLALYLLGGLAALAVSIAASPNATAPLPAASGALLSVLGAAVALLPGRGVLAPAPRAFALVELPAIAFALAWVALYILLGAARVDVAGGAPYYAQLAGIGFGALAAGPRAWPATRFRRARRRRPATGR